MTREKIEQYFRRYYAPLHAAAFRLLADEAMAADVVHDVFASLLSRESADDIPDCTVRAYLFSAVRNRAFNSLRHLSVRERVSAMLPFSDDDICDEAGDDAAAETLRKHIAADLSEPCRKVLLLRFDKGMTYRQIADTLGISETAVYKNLRHAIDILRTKIRANG